MKRLLYAAAIAAVLLSFAINLTVLSLIYDNRFAASTAAIDVAATYASQKEISQHISAIDARSAATTNLLTRIYWRTCKEP